jgi:putative ABC transport system substrate-binding protein
MRRRQLCLVLLLGAAGRAAFAQVRPLRIYAITYRGKTEVERGFEDFFAARGIPVRITYRDLALDVARLPGFIEEIRRDRPDLIYTWGTSATLGVAGAWDRVDPARHITDMPVIFTLVAAPVAARIVPTLASSGRMLTGVSHLAPLEAQMRALASYRPLRVLGMIYTASEANSRAVARTLDDLGRRQGFRLIAQPFRLDAHGRPSAEGAAVLVAQLKAAGADWLYLPPDSFLATQAREHVVPAALALGLPTFASTEPLMAAGALAGLVGHYYAIGQFTAYKAEQILVGKVPPARIPVESLARFSFQIRMPVARRLGLPPPLAMFNYAEILDDPLPEPNS